MEHLRVMLSEAHTKIPTKTSQKLEDFNTQSSHRSPLPDYSKLGLDIHWDSEIRTSLIYKEFFSLTKKIKQDAESYIQVLRHLWIDCYYAMMSEEAPDARRGLEKGKKLTERERS